MEHKGNGWSIQGEQEKIVAAVLSGGGWKGYLHLGALTVLKEANITKDVVVYAGSSVGALISFLICIGASPEQIMTLLTLDDSISTTGCCFEMNKYGIASMEPVKTKIKEMIQACPQTHHWDITFGELLELSGLHLVATVTDIDTMSTRYYNPIDNPETVCIDAVLASCCIPIVFQARTLEGNLCIDGGWSDNFPIEWTKSYLSRIDTEGQVLGLAISTPPERKCRDIWEYLKRVAVVPMHATINKWRKAKNVIQMPWSQGSFDKEQMYKIGMECATNYINTVA